MFLQALSGDLIVRASEHLVDDRDFGRFFATCKTVKLHLQEACAKRREPVMRLLQLMQAFRRGEEPEDTPRFVQRTYMNIDCVSHANGQVLVAYGERGIGCRMVSVFVVPPLRELCVRIEDHMIPPLPNHDPRRVRDFRFFIKPTSSGEPDGEFLPGIGVIVPTPESPVKIASRAVGTVRDLIALVQSNAIQTRRIVTDDM